MSRRLPWKDHRAETLQGFRGLFDAITAAELQHLPEDRWRRGEIAYYLLTESRPDLAEQIRGDHVGTGRDPLAYDANLPAFWAWLEAAWGEQVPTTAPAWSCAAPTAPGLYAYQTTGEGERVTVVYLDDGWLSHAWKADVRWFGPLPDPEAPWHKVTP